MIVQLPVLLILVFFLAALLIPLASLIDRRLPWSIAVLSAAGATAASLIGLREVLANGPIHYAIGGWDPPIGIELVMDPLSAFLTVVLGLVATVVLAHAREPVRRDLPDREMPFYASAMLLLGGFSGIVLTGDLFNLYVFLEISSLAGYALLGCGSGRAAVSAFRYLILGTIGASFYLIGLGFLFVETGSLNMGDVRGILTASGLNPLTMLAMVFMVAGVGVKMALLPLHQWLPDAYTTAPASATALVAPIGTKVAAYVLIRLLFHLFPADEVVANLRVLDLLAYLGAAGILWGSVMAIPQTNLKRMLAYSSVAQIGYIALGIGLGTAYGFIGAVLHILNHAVMKACLFLVAANLELGERGVEIPALDSSVRLAMPATSAGFAVAAISMIGLPPTAGFFSKWYLLLGSWEEGRWGFALVIVGSSLLNAVYFFRILERMFLGRAGAADGEGGAAADATVRPGRAVAAFRSAPVLLLAGSLLVLGVGNAFIVNRIIQPMLGGIF